MRRIEAIAKVIVALSLLVLSACGGGGGGVASVGGGVGTGGTGITVGTVTGFGSVVVDGISYNSATPLYFAGSDQSDAAQVTSAAMGLGNQVQMQLDAQGNPTEVVIEPELVGAVSQIGSGQFVVNGVTVRVNANVAAGPVTYFSGLTGFANLAAGMQVEVHGAFGVDANNQTYIQASLIEQLPASNAVNRVSGLVSNLNVVAGTFRLGNITVQFNASTTVLPVGSALADGQWVNVWSKTALAANSALSAGVIRRRTLAGVVGPVQIGGLVYSLSGTQFQVSGFTVDASASTLISALNGLTLGEYVVVQGQVNSSTGALVASGIRTFAAEPAQVELSGTITGYVSPSSFLVRGVPVDATQAQFPNGASASNLRNGVFVDVLGSVSGASGNLITAKTVSVGRTAPKGRIVNYRGTVSQLDAANRTFVLTGPLDGVTASASVILASNVAFANGSAAQLVNNVIVEVEATNSAGGIVAYSVSILGTDAPTADPASGTLETQGLAYGVTSSQFVVNGITIQINGVAPQGGSLVNGIKVEVEFTPSGAQNLANKISIDH